MERPSKINASCVKPSTSLHEENCGVATLLPVLRALAPPETQHSFESLSQFSQVLPRSLITDWRWQPKTFPRIKPCALMLACCAYVLIHQPHHGSIRAHIHLSSSCVHERQLREAHQVVTTKAQRHCGVKDPGAGSRGCLICVLKNPLAQGLSSLVRTSCG